MKKYISLTLVLLLLISLLTGCGASTAKGSSMDYNSRSEEAVAEPMEAPMAAQDNALTTNESGGSEAIPENRKWIITVELSAETEDLDTMLTQLDEHIRKLNGYVENQNVYNGSNYASYRYRNARLTVRIPAESVDLFTEGVSGISNVVRSSKSLEDITLTYSATESRVKALQTEESRLLALMEQADNMTDLLEIEARLTEVRYELERYTTQLKGFDNKVDYATIHLSIEEVQEYTPVAEVSRWERICTGFVSSVKNVFEGILDFFVWLIVSSPYLVVFGAIVAVIIVLIKRRKKRKADQKQKAAPPAAPEKKEE